LVLDFSNVPDVPEALIMGREEKPKKLLLSGSYHPEKCVLDFRKAK
jgi:hypothetical protein